MYIRTKYEIVKVETIADIQTKVIFKDNFVAQSETIEELCDMFVYCKRGFYEIYRQLDFAHYDKEYIKNGGTIKGAIWTSKGLIYVAKMNSEGKLELI